MTDALKPLQTIGILGGGQLGRMLAVAAARLGLRVHIFDPKADCPASCVAAEFTRGAFDDAEALRGFAARVHAITFEWESVPTAALSTLTQTPPIRPNLAALQTMQDRLTEKEFLRRCGLETAPFAAVDNDADLHEGLERVGAPAILKTRRDGYDGRGQTWIDSASQGHEAVAALRGQPALLEGVVRFDREVSIIAARALDGSMDTYDPGENVHEQGILRRTRVPAELTPALRAQAVDIARRILEALDYVGVLGIEFFVVGDRLLVNEIAPRVHNSGHWTQDACVVDQFEQHIRCVAGWPLGTCERFSDVEMHNLLGSDVERYLEYLSTPGTALHLYGKRDPRDGRKMGHINRLRSAASDDKDAPGQ